MSPPADYIRTASDVAALAEGCYFDEERAARAIAWIEGTLNLRLYAWQRDALRRYFGWRRPDGGYRFTKINIWIPKKNGKSWWVSALLGYKVFELKNARIYSIAFCAKQASIVMDELIKMCKRAPKLRPLMVPRRGKIAAFCTPFRRDFTYKPNGTKYEALADNIQANDGIIPDVLVFDEIHRMKNKQVDVVDGSTSNNPTALKVIISTAGSGDKTHRSFQKYEYTKKVLAGEVIDTQLLPIIYECPDAAALRGEEIYDLDRLVACNPVLQEVPEKREQAIREIEEARRMRNDAYWRRFRLNQWISEDGDEYIAADAYEACEVEPLDDADLDGAECWVGIDKSAGAWDFSAVVALYRTRDGRVYERHWTFAHADRVAEMGDRDDMDYTPYVDAGELVLIPAEAVADEWLYEWIRSTFARARVKQVAADPYVAAYILERLKADGHEVVAVQQSNNRLLSPVIGDYIDRVKQARIVHPRNKLVSWQLACTRAITTAKDCRKLVKAGSSTTGRGGVGHIDNVDALINGLAALRAAELESAVYGDGDAAVVG